jgi:hypothetical protein
MEAVTTEIMVHMTLHGQPSKLSAAAGQAAARHVADYVAHGGKLTDLARSSMRSALPVFNWLGEKLDYQIVKRCDLTDVKRCDLTDVQRLYYQVVDFMYLAIKLYNALSRCGKPVSDPGNKTAVERAGTRATVSRLLLGGRSERDTKHNTGDRICSLRKVPYEFCADCVFWLEWNEFEALEGRWGECHLHPPNVPIPEAPYMTHPMTSESDFCSHAVLRRDSSNRTGSLEHKGS